MDLRSSIPRHLVLSEADDAGPPHTIEENYIDGDVEEVEDTLQLVGEDVQTASSSVHGLEESTSTSEMFGDITDELLFAFARHTSQGLSDDAVRMSYTEALYMSNSGLRFGYDDEKKLSDRMNLLARVDEKFYCAKCDGQLQTSTTRCNNLGCERAGVRIIYRGNVYRSAYASRNSSTQQHVACFLSNDEDVNFDESYKQWKSNTPSIALMAEDKKFSSFFKYVLMKVGSDYTRFITPVWPSG
ncbi:hypothetical protein Aduo_012013 [Ancylostoma duodenale]